MRHSDDLNGRKRRTLYRDKKHGKIAGVCAGIANYFNIEAWLVRVAFITALIFFSGFFAVAYVAAWLVLDEQPLDYGTGTGSHGSIELKTRVWQAGEPPRRAFHEIKSEFSELETKLQSMERYVTSNEYQLNRELNRL